MSFSPYPEYRDSEVEWLGEMPAAWDVAKFRHIFRESGEKIDDEVVGPMLSVSGYRGIEVKSYEDDHQRRSDEDLVGYRIVRPGQLVVNTMWLNYAGLGVSEHEGHVSPAYRSYWIEADVDPRYIHHLMRSSVYVQGYTQLLTGIRPNSLQMSRDNLMGFPVLLPPLQDQQYIAAFLDRETAKIDELVAEQERLIALLKEKRQAVISHAVTKGLDPDAPMKDSGIQWLGEIPAHWEVIPLKKALTFQEGPGIMAADFQDAGVPLMRVAGVGTRWATLDGCNFLNPDKVEQKWSHFRLVEGDLVISASASMGTISEVGPDAAGAVPYTGLIRFQPTEDLNRDYARSIFGSSLFLTQIDLLKAGAMIQHFGPTHLRQMLLVIPPKAEQLEIVEALEEAVDQIDQVADQANRTVALLKERRAALISAAVTGKIDVRGLVEQHEMEAA